MKQAFNGATSELWLRGSVFINLGTVYMFDSLFHHGSRASGNFYNARAGTGNLPWCTDDRSQDDRSQDDRSYHFAHKDHRS